MNHLTTENADLPAIRGNADIMIDKLTKDQFINDVLLEDVRL